MDHTWAIGIQMICTCSSCGLLIHLDWRSLW